MKNERPTQMKPVHDGNIQYENNMGEVGKIYN